MDEEYADITFEIGGGLVGSSLTLFHAHRIVLTKAATQLEELCLKSNDGASHIRIHDVSPDSFKALLLYIYGCEIPDFGKEISRTKEILEVADKYGVTNLKIESEVRYVSSIKLNLNNIVENLLFAESKNCAFLKEVLTCSYEHISLSRHLRKMVLNVRSRTFKSVKVFLTTLEISSLIRKNRITTTF